MSRWAYAAGQVRGWLQPAGVSGRIAANTGVQFVGQAVSITVSLVLAAMLSRYLGPEGYGHFNLVLAYVALLTGLFASWGLGTIVTRELVLGRQQAGALLTNGAALQAAIALAAYLLLVVSLLFSQLEPQLNLAVLLWGLTILLTPLDLVGVLFQARLELRYTVAAGAVGRLMTLLLVAAVVWMGGSLVVLVLATLFGAASQSLSVFLLAARRVELRLRLHPPLWGTLLRHSWPLAISTIFAAMIGQFPVLALGWFSDATQVGLYAVASRIFMLLLFVPQAFAASLYPIMARYQAVDRAALYRLTQRSLAGMLGLGVAVGLAVILLLNPIILWLFGKDYAGSTTVLYLLIWGMVVLFPGIVAANLLFALGLQRGYTVILAIGSAIQAGSLAIVARPFGAVGVAAAVSVSYTIIVAATVATGWYFVSRGRLDEPGSDSLGLLQQ